ncbi:MAG TPA: YeeE/YedE family protein [Methylomirabilota bacterium]|nr:YeeE/YedE family protein [Methylomirabilota bacterium]
MEPGWSLYVSALTVGILFGYVLQRGGFCLTRALANLVLSGDATILRAWILALVVAIIGVQALVSLHVVDVPVHSFRWLANILGGLLFGVGMILAGGCAGSTWYRVGEGAVGAVVVLLGFAIGASVVGIGALAPVRRMLQEPTLTVGDAPPTLANALGVSPWIVIAGLALMAGPWFLRGRGGAAGGKWPWGVTGGAVGLLIIAGWWASSLGDGPQGITFSANTGHLLTYVMVGFPNRMTWGMLLLPGVAVGAFAGAWLAGEFRWKLPPGWSLVKLFGGGLLMGGAALLGDGCNISHGLTNLATLAVSSLVSFACMGLGGWATLWALYLRAGASERVRAASGAAPSGIPAP